MILETSSEASDHLNAFKELNGLTVIVQGKENYAPAPEPSVLAPPQPVQPPLTNPSYSAEFQEHGHTDDQLLPSLPPFPSPSQIRPSHQDVLSYLNLAPTVSDAETTPRQNSDLSSSDRPHLNIPNKRIPQFAVTPLPAHQERRTISISDICSSSNVPVKTESVVVGAKRKYDGIGRSAKKRKMPQPSKFCHVCVQSREKVAMAPCANVVTSVCRKNVCIKCIEKHQFGHEWRKAVENREIIKKVQAGELDLPPQDAWKCFHCREICPQSAQCKIYERTNRRRHLFLKQRKLDRERNHAMRAEFKSEFEERRMAEALLSSDGDTDLPLPPLPIGDIIPDNEKMLRQSLEELPSLNLPN